MKNICIVSHVNLALRRKLASIMPFTQCAKTVDYFVEKDSTANICSIDLSKAFD